MGIRTIRVLKELWFFFVASLFVFIIKDAYQSNIPGVTALIYIIFFAPMTCASGFMIRDMFRDLWETEELMKNLISYQDSCKNDVEDEVKETINERRKNLYEDIQKQWNKWPRPQMGFFDIHIPICLSHLTVIVIALEVSDSAYLSIRAWEIEMFGSILGLAVFLMTLVEAELKEKDERIFQLYEGILNNDLHEGKTLDSFQGYQRIISVFTDKDKDDFQQQEQHKCNVVAEKDASRQEWKQEKDNLILSLNKEKEKCKEYKEEWEHEKNKLILEFDKEKAKFSQDRQEWEVKKTVLMLQLKKEKAKCSEDRQKWNQEKNNLVLELNNEKDKHSEDRQEWVAL